jgi:hypothetical protein
MARRLLLLKLGLIRGSRSSFRVEVGLDLGLSSRDLLSQ